MIIQLLIVMAFANFAGSWKGEGTLESTSGGIIPCDFEFQLQQSDSQIDVLVQRVGCDGIVFVWNPYSANIINGEMFNTKTGIYGGTITDTQLRVNYIETPESGPYIINADKLSENTANFEMILEGMTDKKYLRSILHKK